MRYRHVILLFAAVITFLCAAAPAEEWKLRKNKKGIQIYTRHVPGSGFMEFKAVTEVNTRMASVLMLMEDLDSYTRLFPAVIEVKLLKTISSSEFIMYHLIKAPLPAQKRDSIIRVKAKRDPVTRAVVLELSSHWDMLPERKNVVRVKNLSGSWTFTPDSRKGTITITYQLFNEPGGTLPAWIANTAIVNRPFKTFKNLKEMLEMLPYSEAKESDVRMFK